MIKCLECRQNHVLSLAHSIRSAAPALVRDRPDGTIPKLALCHTLDNSKSARRSGKESRNRDMLLCGEKQD